MNPSGDPYQPPRPHMPDEPPPGYSERGQSGPDAVEAVTQQQAEGPPEYTEAPAYGTINVSDSGMDTKAQLAEDGRINININQRSLRLSSVLTPVLRAQWGAGLKEKDYNVEGASYQIPDFAKDTPPLNILIQIIGSRGDVQPFIALGKQLKERYRHRVRVATHPTFKGFVEENGLEFFSLGGDPSELMAFMVKNPGLMPGVETLKSGEVSKRRKSMWEMLLGGWRACIEPGDGMSYQPAVGGGNSASIATPFVADAIIANPPSFGHIHCAERLGVPLHLMFTMPWSPTSAFPHPLANIQSSNAESNITNFLSYALVDMMTWQGLGDLVNRFREGTLGLEAVSTMWAPGMISRLKVPHTYCWSPTLIPKPADWPSRIKISGFYFLSLASSYSPPPELERFLNAGPPPVYIGFGSIVVEDPNALTRKILEAVAQVGCRALVSKGWGGVGAGELDIPENVMLLGNCPHDWLFPRCAAVVHHGGAGTTAAGIRCGKPTVICSFFGDQPFWGAMVAKAGAGPNFIPHKELTSQNLALAIQAALGREMQARAEAMGDSIKAETGVENGAMSFLSSVEEMGLARCDLLPDRVAVWKVRSGIRKLSALAASVLVEANLIEGGFGGLRLWRHKEWPVNSGPTDPVTGGAGAIVGTMGSIMMGVGDFPIEIFKAVTKDKGKGVEGQPSTPGSTPGSPMHDNTSVDSFATATSEKTGKSEKIRPGTPGTPGTPNSTTDKGKQKEGGGFKFDAEFVGNAMGATKGVRRIVGAGMRSPMDFTLGISQGFRNAPALYGDEIRPETRVTGFHSGLKAAGKEFSLGFYDGITGLVTQPIKGAKQEGAAGALKGFGRGIGGLILKPGAGIWAIPAYAMKGIHREIAKLGTKDLTGYISSARAAQGVHETLQSPLGTKELVIERWTSLNTSPGSWSGRISSWSSGGSSSSQNLNKKKLVDMRSYDDDRREAGNDSELQRALRESAAVKPRHTSTWSSGGTMDKKEKGNTAGFYGDAMEDDPDLQRALRDSISTQNLPTYQPPAYQSGGNAATFGNEKRRMSDDQDELQRAMWTSAASSSQAIPHSHTWSTSADEKRQPIAMFDNSNDHDDEDEELRRAVQASLSDAPGAHVGASSASAHNPELSREAQEFQEALRMSLAESERNSRSASAHFSKTPYTPPAPLAVEHGVIEAVEDDDDELARAVQDSLRLEEERKRKNEEEERIVMEYVARASREEEELRRRRQKAQGSSSRDV